MKTCPYCGRENVDAASQCCECGTSGWVEALATATANGPNTSVTKALESPGTIESHESQPESEFPDIEPDILPDEEAALCSYCVFPNRPEVVWCKRCGAPIHVSATMDPLRVCIASGFMWRGIIRGRPKASVLILTWILFFPKMILGIGIMTLVLLYASEGDESVWIFAFAAFHTVVAFRILTQVTDNFLKRPPIQLE